MLIKSKKGFKTMFKNINLKRLNGKELEILLTSLDLYKDKIQDTYQRTKAKEIARDKLVNKLEDYADKICEAIQGNTINNEADELRKWNEQQQKDNAKMYALNDIERDTQ